MKINNKNIYILISIIGIIFILLQGYRIVESSNNINLNIMYSKENFYIDTNSQIYNQSFDFYIDTLINPIYYSFGSDFDHIKFKDPSSKYFKKYNKCSNIIDFYPNNFLTELQITNKLTKKYLELPTNNNAIKLSEQQRLTAWAYIEDSKNFKKSFESLSMQNNNYIMYNGEEIDLDDLNKIMDTNIDNALIMLKKIDERENYIYNKYLRSQYNIKENKKLILNSFNDLNPEYVLDYSQAANLMTYQISDSKDDDYVKILPEDLFLTEIPMSCYQNKNAYVYGFDKDIYSHMTLAEYKGEFNFVDSYRYKHDFEMYFKTCNCPYVEEDRVNWYLVRDIYNKLNFKKTSNIDLENKFIKDPTYYNLELLSEAYKNILINSINFEKNQNEEENYIFSLYNNIKTKFYLYPELYDDVDYSNGMKYFMDGSSEELCSEYQDFLIVETYFHLNFMSWSDAVYLDELRYSGKDFEKHKLEQAIMVDESSIIDLLSDKLNIYINK